MKVRLHHRHPHDVVTFTNVEIAMSPAEIEIGTELTKLVVIIIDTDATITIIVNEIITIIRPAAAAAVGIATDSSSVRAVPRVLRRRQHIAVVVQDNDIIAHVTTKNRLDRRNAVVDPHRARAAPPLLLHRQLQRTTRVSFGPVEVQHRIFPSLGNSLRHQRMH